MTKVKKFNKPIKIKIKKNNNDLIIQNFSFHYPWG